MASSKTEEKRLNNCSATEWLEEDNLMLLECWARDGYTFRDISNKIGVGSNTLTTWRKKYPEINEALKKGREIIDYKVENALLKSALGYKTRDVKVITNMQNGRIISTTKEVIDREQQPNVYAIQCWLFNRLPSKWKKNRDSILNMEEEDTTIQVTVTRADKSIVKQKPDEVDEEWQDIVNNEITINRKSKEEIKTQKASDSKQNDQLTLQIKNDETKVVSDDLDAWPDDWDDEWEEGDLNEDN